MRTIVMVAERGQELNVLGQFGTANIAAELADNRLPLQPKLWRSVLTD